MKKILLVVVIVVICASMFAQITPYGSVRAGFWYEMTDEDFNIYRNGVEQDRFQMNFGLQPNSRFGVNFKNDGLTANVEFGNVNNGEFGNLRFLWGKQQFENWSLTVGLTEDATNQGAAQVFGGDNLLRGWGAIYNGRNPLIRADWNNFYLALIRPYTARNPDGAVNNEIDALIPRINFGYNWNHKTVRLLPTFVFQMYEFNELDPVLDDNGNAIPDTDRHGGDVMSWLGALTFDYNENQFSSRVHVHYGVNIAHMGYDAPIAAWNVLDDETEDTTTLGGFLTLGWDFTDNFNLNAGIGYTQSENDLWEETESRMAFYVQGVFRVQSLRITPEVGFLDFMDDRNGNTRGTQMYFGTQLRLDF